MKVIIEKRHIETEYPRVMIHKDDLDRKDPLIVLFSAYNCGIVLSVNIPNGTILHSGEYRTDLPKKNFIDYMGSITLSN